MNVLFLSQARQLSDQQSYHDAMLRAQAAGRIQTYTNIPFYGCAQACGWDGLWRTVVETCQRERTELVFFQFFHGHAIPSPRACVEALRKLPSPPMIAVSCGDLFSDHARRAPRAFLELSVLSDVTFLTSMGRFAALLARLGARRLMLMPHAFSTTVFALGRQRPEPAAAEFDVVMVASRGRALNPFRYMTWASLKRQRIVDRLYRRYGKRFAVFGHGWKNHPAWQGPVEFNRQDEVFGRGRLVVDGRPPFAQDYYASDRPFYVAGAGVPLVQHVTPRFEALFRPDHHAYYVGCDEAIVDVCDRVLGMDEAGLRARADDTVRLVAEKHLVDHRVGLILDVCERVGRVAGGLGGRCAAGDIPLPYFLPEVDLERERAFALVNWS